MKHIGIVDITTIGACICANEIVALAAKDDIQKTGAHPEFTMHAFSFHLYKELVLKKDWDGLAKLVLQSIHKLQKTGADFIIIPSNTPHYAIHAISAASPLPVLNLIEITANECKRLGFRKAAILGTKATMEGGLYTSYLEKNLITPIIPEPIEMENINKLIFDEIIPSKINVSNVEKVRQDILRLDCDGIILGCTELPEVYNEHNLIGKKVVDTTRLIAKKALEFSRFGQLAS